MEGKYNISENAPESKEPDYMVPQFSFIIDGMSQENADYLFDIICIFAGSHGHSVIGSYGMESANKIGKEAKEWIETHLSEEK